jgi:hypothetical protein
MTLLPAVVRGTGALPAELLEDLEATAGYLAREKEPATRRAYRSEMALFSAWCASRGLSALPARPETVAVFLGSQAKAGVKAATLSRRVAAGGCRVAQSGSMACNRRRRVVPGPHPGHVIYT